MIVRPDLSQPIAEMRHAFAQVAAAEAARPIELVPAARRIGVLPRVVMFRLLSDERRRWLLKSLDQLAERNLRSFKARQRLKRPVWLGGFGREPR